MTVREELIDILGFEPSLDVELQAEDWREFNPNGDLTEWVEDMMEIGGIR